ncbi:MAG: TIGR04104 family putative zinc finger protein [Lysinibacillus sp.]
MASWNKRYIIRRCNLQKCGQCNSSFSWSKIFKSYWYKWNYGPLECDNCGTIHKITILGRCTIVAVSILPMQIFCYFLIPFDGIFLPFVGGFLIATVGILLSPYVVRYKEKL